MQSFKIIKPTEELAPYIRYYWILKDDAAFPVSERTLPVGCIQLVFHKGKQLLLLKKHDLQPQSFICGQSFGFSDVLSTGEIEMLTVVFQPYAAKVFLRLPLYLLNGLNVPIKDLDDKELSLLARKIGDTTNEKQCICLIEQFLLQRLSVLPEFHLKRMAKAIIEINNRPQINISRLADLTCWSNRQFSRVFMEYVGTTPKDFMRVIRMQRALHEMQSNPSLSLVQIAYECGFTDQSHMIKEFKLFSGYTPTEYLSVCTPYSDYFSEE